MITSVLLLLILLQIKHWYVDFVIQSAGEVAGKGIYGNWTGIFHSIKHGIGTAIAVLIVLDYNYWFFIMLLSMADFLIHYHVDWIKMHFGTRDVQRPAFWNQLGLDQMAHQFTYLGIAVAIT